MSRIAKLPVFIPDTVNIKLSNLDVEVTGPKGSMKANFAGNISIVREGNTLNLKALDDSKSAVAMSGTARSIINNMVKGVSDGFSEELEIVGVGYRCSVANNYLNLYLGYSHNTKIWIPEGINASSPKPTVLIISSCDKQLLGEFIASVKKQRPTEPYKGKGIRIKGAYVKRKASKKK